MGGILLIAIIVVGLLAVGGAFRPRAPEAQIVVVPVEITETPTGSWGCFPVIALVLLLVLALSANW